MLKSFLIEFLADGAFDDPLTLGKKEIEDLKEILPDINQKVYISFCKDCQYYCLNDEGHECAQYPQNFDLILDGVGIKGCYKCRKIKYTCCPLFGTGCV